MIAQSGYLTEGTTLTVYDNFVEGVHTHCCTR